jgi:UDP-N-acetylmuramoyl-tripeptide--D-alanyl-D-alanine ligase
MLLPQIFQEDFRALLPVIILFFVFTDFYIIKEIRDHAFKRPVPTLKIATIAIGTVLLIIMLTYPFIGSGMINEAEIPLVIYILLPSIISLAVLLINPFFDLQKKRILIHAAAKMRSLKKVRTIGITGSYGKTSTKEFLYSILSDKYKTVKTEGNNNTNIGVAYTVLNKVDDDLDFFVCEMGAYKIGEIKEICGIARPEIGILTGINEQHVELFGSLENTIKAKFELIESLPENGLAVINEKLKYQNDKLHFKVKKSTYFSLATVNSIRVHRDYSEFEYKGKIFRLNLPGKHYIENLMSAIIVSEYLGMNVDEISDSISRIKPTEYLMKKLEGTNGSIFIDDSYSANPDGVLAALDYLCEAFPDHKKVIVFPGFIELGDESDDAYCKLFKRICEVCQTAYLLNSRMRNAECGHSKTKFIFEKDFTKTADMLRNILDKNTVVLFESRGAGAVMRKFKNLK